MKVTTLGIDVAKSVFQVHGVDERGNVALQKRGVCEIVWCSGTFRCFVTLPVTKIVKCLGKMDSHL